MVRINAAAEKTLFPLLVHSRLRPILRDVYVSGGSAGSTLSVDLPGLVTSFPLAKVPEDGSPIQFKEVTVPLTFTVESLEQRIPRSSQLRLLLDGREVWVAEVMLMPPTAVSTDLLVMDSLAALVVPDDPAVAELVRRARQRPRSGPGRAGFPTIAAARAAEIFFEELGGVETPSYAWEPSPLTPRLGAQLVRLPNRVVADNEATCIDLALFLCSALDRIGRAPVLVIVDYGESWHVIAGVWTDELTFRNPRTKPRLSDIQAYCQEGRLFLLDPSSLVSNAKGGDAHRLALLNLEQAFGAVMVDVQACRDRSIWPLAIAEASTAWSGARRPIALASATRHYQPTTDLLDALASGAGVLVLGDALDPRRVPSSKSLAEALSATLRESCDDLLDAGTLFEVRYGRKALIEIVLKHLKPMAQQGTQIYELLASSPIKTVVSLYADPCLEQALTLAPGPFSPLIDDADLANLGRPGRELFLLGGSALSGNGLVLTHHDHIRLQHRMQLLARGLRDRLVSGPIILFQCDPRDLNLQALLLESTRHLSRATLHLYCLDSETAWHGLGQVTRLDITLLGLLRELRMRPLPPASSVTIGSVFVASTPAQLRRDPFKYLDYYETEDAAFFFGRDDDLSHLCREVFAARGRVTVLAGRSGVGKTSLVKAGFIPFINSTRGQLACYYRIGHDSRRSIVEELDASISSLIAQAGSGCEYVIVLDQFEESLIKTGSALLAAFARTLSRYLLDPGTSVRLVLVIREDYLSRLASLRSELPEVLGTVVLLEEFDRSQAYTVLTESVRCCGMSFDDGLAAAILDDLSPDRILPAHLQIVGAALMDDARRLKQSVFTMESYNRLGRSSGILSTHLVRVMRELPAALSAIGHAVLRSLVTSERTKDLVSLAQLAVDLGKSAEEVAQVLHEFIHVHRIVREVPGTPVLFELSHEALIATIQTWFDEAEQRRREVQDLLAQEIRNAKQLTDFEFPVDKLKIIDDHIEVLRLDLESVVTISRAHMKRGRLSDRWALELDRFGLEGWLTALLGTSPPATSRELAAAVLDLSPSLSRFLPVLDIGSALVEEYRARRRAGHNFSIDERAALALKDRTGGMMAAFCTLDGRRVNERFKNVFDSWSDSKDALNRFAAAIDCNAATSPWAASGAGDWLPDAWLPLLLGRSGSLKTERKLIRALAKALARTDAATLLREQTLKEWARLEAERYHLLGETVATICRIEDLSTLAPLVDSLTADDREAMLRAGMSAFSNDVATAREVDGVQNILVPFLGHLDTERLIILLTKENELAELALELLEQRLVDSDGEFGWREIVLALSQLCESQSPYVDVVAAILFTYVCPSDLLSTWRMLPRTVRLKYEDKPQLLFRSSCDRSDSEIKNAQDPDVSIAASASVEGFKWSSEWS